MSLAISHTHTPDLLSQLFPDTTLFFKDVSFLYTSIYTASQWPLFFGLAKITQYIFSSLTLFFSSLI